MRALPEPQPGRWTLIVAPRAALALMTELIARLAQRGPVRVLDGGDRFQAHPIARTLRRTPGLDLNAALQRVHLSRAFTCYQMVTLLEEVAAAPHPDGPLPTVALDLLTTFYDESVPLAESQRLLEVCLAHLAELAAQGPLAVSVRPPRQGGPRLRLVDRLEAAADQVIRLEPFAPPPPRRLL